MIAQMLLSLAIGISSPTLENEEADAAFNFYLKEMVQHAMAVDAPMANLIEKYLVEATFDTTSESVFKTRLRAIQATLEDHPDKIDRFQNLDSKFQRAFDKKISAGKQKRLIYTAAGAAAGAAIGAVIGVPVGKAMGTGTKALFISVPTGALVGAGAGFLLGDIVAMPDYSYERGSVDWDLKEIEDEVEGRK